MTHCFPSLLRSGRSVSPGTMSPVALVMALLLSAFVSGCQTANPPVTTASYDYRQRHPILITNAPETLDLPIGEGGRHLNRAFASRITDFGYDARRYGNSRVEILVPSGGANEQAVHAVTPEIRTALTRAGIKRSNIRIRSYAVQEPKAQPPVRLSYDRIKATVEPCGNWDGSIGALNVNNVDYGNFGCETQANLAAMVENPADLIAPRATTAPDQMRRATVLKNYEAGSQTASDYKEGSGADVSSSGS